MQESQPPYPHPIRCTHFPLLCYAVGGLDDGHLFLAPSLFSISGGSKGAKMEGVGMEGERSPLTARWTPQPQAGSVGSADSATLARIALLPLLPVSPSSDVLQDSVRMRD